MIVVPPAGALTTPGHVSLNPLGVSITTPAGNVSTKSAVNVAATPFVFPNVIVNVLVPPAPIVSGENTFPTVGNAAVTVRSSEAVPLSGASLLVTTDVVFVTVPGVDEVTSTSTVHVPDARILPPLKFNVVSPAPGAHVGEPQFVVVAFGVLATDTPAGRLSVKSTPVNPAAFGLTISIVSVLTPPTTIKSPINVFVTVGGAKFTVSVSVAAALFETP